MAERAWTRLYVQGIDSPIVSRVAKRERRRVTVAQPLPFLRLHNPVRDEAHRHGRIESVRVSMKGNEPHLEVAVVYEGDAWAEPTPRVRRRVETTAPFETAAPTSDPPPAGGPSRPDSTTPYRAEALPASQVDVAVGPSAQRVSSWPPSAGGADGGQGVAALAPASGDRVARRGMVAAIFLSLADAIEALARALRRVVR